MKSKASTPMNKALLILLLNTFILSVYSKSALDKFIQNPLLENANISLLIIDAQSDSTLCEYRSKNSITCASTTKLVTTATALEILGPEYQFKTTLQTDGEVDDNGILNGNLIIRGSGDPTLGSFKMGDPDFLQKWTESIKNTGIKHIKGGIVANIGTFERQPINPKWIWEDMGNYYAPGIHAISYLDNTFRLYLRSGKPNTKPEIIRTEPEIPGISFINQLRAANISEENSYIHGIPFSNQRTIVGEVPANRAEVIIKGDIPNPALLLAMHLEAKLKDIGIETEESPFVDYKYTATNKTIYTHFSAPLKDIITETNVKSNNHYAEYLFKQISLTQTKIASNGSAIRIIRDFWKKQDLPIEQLFQADGSGLAPSNAISAEFFVQLLDYMRNKSKYSTVFRESLAVAGVKGTFKNWLANTPLEGKVFGKSGTLSRVKAYAGYIETGKKSMIFAIIVNNANGSSHDVSEKVEQLLLEITK